MKPSEQYEKLKKTILSQAGKIIDDDRYKALFHDKLSRLTKKQMRLLKMYYFESKSIRTIGKILRIPKSSVYSKIRSIINQLSIKGVYEQQDAHLEQEQPPQSLD